MLDLSKETEALARRLADVQSVSIDAVVRQALEARAALLPRERPPEEAAARRARMEQIVCEIAAMPVLDRRSRVTLWTP